MAESTSGDHGEHEEHADRLGIHLFCRPDGQVLEHAAFGGNSDDQHHAHQQTNGVEVNAAEGGFLVEHAAQDEQRGPQQGQNGAIELLRNDERVNNDE